MNNIKYIFLIGSFFCSAISVYGMDAQSANQSSASGIMALIRNLAYAITGRQVDPVKTNSDSEPVQIKVKEKRFSVLELKNTFVALLDEAGLTDVTADVDTKIDTFIRQDCVYLKSSDFHGWTPLHFAALFDRLDIARILLAQKEAKDSVSEDGETPLHLAAQSGAWQVAQLLVSCGANPNAQNYWGETPLHIALDEQQAAVLPLLLTHGARLTVFDAEHKTPLYRAIENGDVQGVKCVFEHALFCSAQEFATKKMICNSIKAKNPDTANTKELYKVIENVVTQRLSMLSKLLKDPVYMQLAKRHKNPVLHNLVDSKNVEQYRAKIEENVRALLFYENR